LYRLLIVDDEPYVVDGLYDLFQETPELEVDLHRAYNAFEALDKMGRHKFDIVLTDVRMPGMSGVELHHRIKERWAHCKIIFLTGYDDFGYIQQTVRNGDVVDYILKTEEDDVVLHAVKRAVAEIDASRASEDYVAKAKQSYKEALPLLRKGFLQRLLHGERGSDGWRRKKFAELEMCLSPHDPVIVIAGRVDRWSESFEEKDKELLLYAVFNIAEEQLSKHGRFGGTELGSSQFAWLCQPGAGAGDSGGRRYLLGILESIQSVCSELLKVSISLAIASREAQWEACAAGYSSARDELLFGKGRGLEMALIDQSQFEEGVGRAEEAKQRALTRKLRAHIHRIGQLEAYLEQGMKDEFFILLDETIEMVPSGDRFVQAEFFLTLGAMFAACLNRTESDMTDRVDLDKLTHFQAHASWREIEAFFKRLAGLVFETLSADSADWNRQVIERLQRYIEDHMEGDLTLGRLAEVVHLNPFYLSRLYKQRTGTTLSDHVTSVRMNAARRLLLESNLKIHEIASRVGYENSTYFTRVFKKLYKSSPQEYRDQSGYKA